MIVLQVLARSLHSFEVTATIGQHGTSWDIFAERMALQGWKLLHQGRWRVRGKEGWLLEVAWLMANGLAERTRLKNWFRVTISNWSSVCRTQFSSLYISDMSTKIISMKILCNQWTLVQVQDSVTLPQHPLTPACWAARMSALCKVATWPERRAKFLCPVCT